MKISKLNIESYRHLENLNFDFTYQTGERKGQPLDKICFIGQSATGKTGLLELVRDLQINLSKIVTNNDYFSFRNKTETINSSASFSQDNYNTIKISPDEIEVNDNILSYNDKSKT